MIMRQACADLEDDSTWSADVECTRCSTFEQADHERRRNELLVLQADVAEARRLEMLIVDADQVAVARASVTTETEVHRQEHERRLDEWRGFCGTARGHCGAQKMAADRGEGAGNTCRGCPGTRGRTCTTCEQLRRRERERDVFPLSLLWFPFRICASFVCPSM